MEYGKYMGGFSKLIRQQRQACSALLASYHFSPNEMVVLVCLAAQPERDTASDICAARGLSRSLVCRSVESLTKRGYLSLQVDAHDHRCVHLHLTPAALPVVVSLQRQRRRFVQRLLSGISAQELAVFDRIFTRMLHNVGDCEEGGELLDRQPAREYDETDHDRLRPLGKGDTT